MGKRGITLLFFFSLGNKGYIHRTGPHDIFFYRVHTDIIKGINSQSFEKTSDRSHTVARSKTRSRVIRNKRQAHLVSRRVTSLKDLTFMVNLQ